MSGEQSSMTVLFGKGNKADQKIAGITTSKTMEFLLNKFIGIPVVQDQKMWRKQAAVLGL